MAYIHSRGNPSSDVWVLVDTPLSNDGTKGYLYSGGLGFVWDKMCEAAGIYDYYVTCYRPDTEHLDSYRNIAGELNHYMPRIIIPLDAIGQKLCKELEPAKRNKNYDPDVDSEIAKYAGSILTSGDTNYPCYIIPTHSPNQVARQYKIRDQVVLDLAKAKSELDYFRANGIMQPLPIRRCKIDFESFDELLYIIEGMNNYPLISNDIETIYPKSGSKWFKVHPGYPITIGLAPTKDFGISFDLFRESSSETVKLWRTLDRLFRNVPQLGQNFFNFDINFYEMLGFVLRNPDCQDTMIRHHVLWPELPHKLQFQTRQYTREKYYKDEGHNWGLKNMDKLKRYNCLDVMVTMEVYEQQQEEFNDRPYLR